MSETTRPSVAILGASTNRDKFGNKSVRAHLKAGYEVYPVNPKAAEIEGLKCFASLQDLPATPDRVSVYLPPDVALKSLSDIAASNAKEVWLNPGSESPELVAESERLGLNVIQACSIIDAGFTPHDFPGERGQ